jgi:diguanylate cyclase
MTEANLPSALVAGYGADVEVPIVEPGRRKSGLDQGPIREALIRADGMSGEVVLRAIVNRGACPSGGVRSCRSLLERPWLVTIVLATILCVAYLVGVFINWGNAADRSLYANLGMIPIGLTATILAARASQSQTNRRSQWAWRLLGAGMLCFFGGDVLFFTYANVLGSPPFPSLADAGYLAYYPLAFAGLLCFPSLPMERRRRTTLYLDCLVVTLGGAVVVLHFFLLPTLKSSYDDLFAYTLSAGYPVGDLVLLAGIAWVLLRRVPGRGRSTLLLAAGLIAGLVADVVYGYQNVQGTFESGGFSDAVYMLSWALFAWAGFAETTCSRVTITAAASRWTAMRSRPGDRRERHWVWLLLPYCLVALGIGMLIYVNRSQLGTSAGVVTLAATALIVVSFVRQSLVARRVDHKDAIRGCTTDEPDER